MLAHAIENQKVKVHFVPTFVPKQKRVLLIDDDPSLEPVFDALLHEVNTEIDIDYVTSAEAAFERLNEASGIWKSTPYDLIIADVFLDGKATGVDVWSLCQEAYPQMPALVMSSLPLNRILELIGRNSINPLFLQKPFHFASCRRTLQEAFNTGLYT